MAKETLNEGRQSHRVEFIGTGSKIWVLLEHICNLIGISEEVGGRVMHAQWLCG